MPNDTGSTRLLILQIHSDWEQESPGQIHIDRIDSNRPLYPTMTPEKMARKLTETANWFDTKGFNRGVILMRYDGMSVALSDEEKPRARVIPLKQLRTHLPDDEAQLTPAQRAEAIAIRRQHVQRRFGF